MTLEELKKCLDGVTSRFNIPYSVTDSLEVSGTIVWKQKELCPNLDSRYHEFAGIGEIRLKIRNDFVYVEKLCKILERKGLKLKLL